MSPCAMKRMAGTDRGLLGLHGVATAGKLAIMALSIATCD